MAKKKKGHSGGNTFGVDKDSGIFQRLNTDFGRNPIRVTGDSIPTPSGDEGKQKKAEALRAKLSSAALSGLPSPKDISGFLKTEHSTSIPGRTIVDPKKKKDVPFKGPRDEKKKDLYALSLQAKVEKDGSSASAVASYEADKRSDEPPASFNPHADSLFREDENKRLVGLNKKIALSLRYRIPEKLSNLEPKKLKKLSNYISEQLEKFRNQRTEMMDRVQTFREAWRNFEKSGLQILIDGQHDVHIPTIFQKGKALHARLFQAVMGVEPPFQLRPLKPVDEKQKQDKQDLLRWVVASYANRGNGLRTEVDKDCWGFVLDGTSVEKHYWARDVRKFVDVEMKEKRPLEVDENGQIVMDEKEVEREAVVYDGPMMTSTNLEDFYCIGQKCEDVDTADIVGDRQLFTRSDVVRMSQMGFFKEEWAEKVLKRQPSSEEPSKGQDSMLAQQLDRLNGLNRDGLGLKAYTIHEMYLRYDIDEDGIDEEIVVWREDLTGTILRLTYLDRVSQNGKRPYVLKKLIPVDGSPYGIGFGEMLYGINMLQDYIVNQRLDSGTFQIFPWFVFRAAAGMDAGKFTIAPGKGIPVDNINDISFPRVNGNPAYGFQEEQLVEGYADKTSSINALAEGQIGGQGITRTASGAAALVQELNTQLDIFIQRYQTGFAKSLKFIDKQTQELLPLGLQYQVIGLDQKGLQYKKFMDRKAIQWDTDFELTGNSVNSNKAIERDVANQIVQMQLNPVVLQSGIVTPSNLYSGYKNLLQKLEVRDIDAYLTAPEEAKGSPYSAKDELQMILVGVKPPMQMNDKHAEKAAFFDEFEASDEFGYLSEAHLPLYLEVKQGHQQMAEAIASQAAIVGQSGLSNNPNLAAQIAVGSGSGLPQGVPNQVADLAPASSPVQG